jgi:hypothetical protein
MRNIGILRFCLGLLPLGFGATSHCVHAVTPANCTSQPNSNTGCEFYAVSLPNWIVDQSTFHFGVAMLNSGTSLVSATITGGGLGSTDVVNLPVGTSVTTTLPWVSAVSTSLSTVKVVGGAYHITVTGQVSALQLNTVEPQISGVASSSNDASLLLPVQSAGKSYRVVSWPSWGANNISYPGNIAVVATAAGTSVQVVAPGTMQPGTGLGFTTNGGTVTLNQGDVLLIASTADAANSAYGSDLTGTTITSSAPVLVWSGHSGTQIPAVTGFADHMEESLPPLAALSNDYFIVRPGVPAADTGSKFEVKIVGTVNATTLTFNPAISGAPSSIGAGASATFEASTDFHLQASHPVVVGTFMEGGQGFTSGVGDPSESMPIPTNQAIKSITFIAPTNLAPIYAQLVAPTNATIVVDSNVATGWTAIGSSGYSTTHVTLCCTDAHQASGDKPFTVSVYAYPAGNTSYWYPGSLGIDDDIFRNGFE